MIWTWLCGTHSNKTTLTDVTHIEISGVLLSLADSEIQIGMCGALTLSLLVFVVTRHHRPCGNCAPNLVNHLSATWLWTTATTACSYKSYDKCENALAYSAALEHIC